MSLTSKTACRFTSTNSYTTTTISLTMSMPTSLGRALWATDLQDAGRSGEGLIKSLTPLTLSSITFISLAIIRGYLHLLHFPSMLCRIGGEKLLEILLRVQI